MLKAFFFAKLFTFLHVFYYWAYVVEIWHTYKNLENNQRFWERKKFSAEIDITKESFLDERCLILTSQSVFA